MTVLVASATASASGIREPLASLSAGMSQRQVGTRRRSARLAFEEGNGGASGNANGGGNDDRQEAPVKKARKVESGSVKGRGKASYDEDDDGFQFSRGKAKAKKAAPAASTSRAAAADSGDDALRRKRRAAQPDPDTLDAATHPRKRRSKRLSGEDADTQISEPIAMPSWSKSQTATTKRSERPVTPGRTAETTSSVPVDDSGATDPAVADGAAKAYATKIALPFADTPVIRRNKEMRKGRGSVDRRRSSSGLRGRRASSLIESGNSTAVPHDKVEVAEFYKHIEQTIPEPHRMKQLLTWCGVRALPEKPTGRVEGASTIMAARAIQEELLNDFKNKPQMSDWFDRDDSTSSFGKKPNPRNVQNAAKLLELEAEIKRLEGEKQAWDELLSASSNPPLEAAQMRDNRSSRKSRAGPSSRSLFEDIDADLLDDPEQVGILTSLLPKLFDADPPVTSRTATNMRTGNETTPAPTMIEAPPEPAKMASPLRPIPSVRRAAGGGDRYPASYSQNLAQDTTLPSTSTTAIDTRIPVPLTSTSSVTIAATALPPAPTSKPTSSSLPPEKHQQAPEPQAQQQQNLNLPSTSPHSISARLRHVASNLEPTIDAFAHGVHALQQYRATAERAADRVLGAAAERLERRDWEARREAGTEGVGVDGVLGALGRVVGGRR